jgi:hypothetical protein
LNLELLGALPNTPLIKQAPALVDSSLHNLLAHSSHTATYSLGPKIFALVDFYTSRLTICLIRKNCENIIYFAMTCFIILYILSISYLFLHFHKFF